MSKIKDQTNKQIVARIVKTQKLLLHFELSAYVFDPGIKCLVLYDKLSINGHGPRYVDFDGSTWEWLEPLLRELVKWREYGNRFNMSMRSKERRKYEVGSKK